jgi:hypothetical protein
MLRGAGAGRHSQSPNIGSNPAHGSGSEPLCEASLFANIDAVGVQAGIPSVMNDPAHERRTP